MHSAPLLDLPTFPGLLPSPLFFRCAAHVPRVNTKTKPSTRTRPAKAGRTAARVHIPVLRRQPPHNAYARPVVPESTWTLLRIRTQPAKIVHQRSIKTPQVKVVSTYRRAHKSFKQLFVLTLALPTNHSHMCTCRVFFLVCKACTSGYYPTSPSAQSQCLVGYKCYQNCAAEICPVGTYQDTKGQTSCKGW